jgi:heme-degrading monooxygenase HmoA
MVHRAVAASTQYGATGHVVLSPDPARPTRRVLIAQFPDEAAVRSWDESEDREPESSAVRQREPPAINRP